MANEVEKLVEDVLTLLESTTIFTVPPHYEHWQSGFKSLDSVRKSFAELKVRVEQSRDSPAWLVADSAALQSRLNDFVPLRDDFDRQFPHGGDSHNWRSRPAAERQLEELQRQVGSLKGNIRSYIEVRNRASHRTEQFFAYGFGVVFVVVLLVIAFFTPNPSPFQFVVYKVVLALAAAGVAAMIPGFIQFNIPTVVRAGGALAVFAIVFFKNPASLVTQKVDPDFIALSTDTDQPLSVIVDVVKRKQNVSINFGPGCGPSIPKSLIEKGEYEGKDIPSFLDSVRQRAQGEEPVYHTVKKEDRRYEISCP